MRSTKNPAPPLIPIRTLSRPQLNVNAVPPPFESGDSSVLFCAPASAANTATINAANGIDILDMVILEVSIIAPMIDEVD
jgi:hypothetical protein